MSAQLLSLLVVESNPADAYLTAEALKQAGLVSDITVIDDGKRALDHLEGQSAPDMIFLDLNLVAMSGLDVLQKIRAHPRFGATPVVIMSGSESAADVHKSYQLGANCYIKKPSTLDDFLRFMKIFYEFWGTVATLPPNRPLEG
jgi:CheY-like chemotaxis protein